MFHGIVFGNVIHYMVKIGCFTAMFLEYFWVFLKTKNTAKATRFGNTGHGRYFWGYIEPKNTPKTLSWNTLIESWVSGLFSSPWPGIIFDRVQFILSKVWRHVAWLRGSNTVPFLPLACSPAQLVGFVGLSNAQMCTSKDYIHPQRIQTMMGELLVLVRIHFITRRLKLNPRIGTTALPFAITQQEAHIYASRRAYLMSQPKHMSPWGIIWKEALMNMGYLQPVSIQPFYFPLWRIGYEFEQVLEAVGTSVNLFILSY